MTERAARDARAPPNECPICDCQSFEVGGPRVRQHTSEDDYVAGERRELFAHSPEHHAPHRVVRDEEARVYASRVVSDAAGHEWGEGEVAICGRLELKDGGRGRGV